MALITGSGTVEVSGKIHDIEFVGPGVVNETTALVTSFDSSVRGCKFSGYYRAIDVERNNLFVTDSVFIDYNQAIYLGSADDATIIGNHFDAAAIGSGSSRTGVVGVLDTGTTIVGNWFQSGRAVFMSDSYQCIVAHNKMTTQAGSIGVWVAGINVAIESNLIVANGTGVFLADSEGCVIDGNIIREPGVSGATNTHDGVRVVDSVNCRVVDNKVIASTHSTNKTRYGINLVSGTCNIVVGNDLGDPADYASDALVDTATDTQLFYPADATYGDNFTICPPGSA